jgi:hypothetical protein
LQQLALLLSLALSVASSTLCLFARTCRLPLAGFCLAQLFFQGSNVSAQLLCCWPVDICLLRGNACI